MDNKTDNVVAVFVGWMAYVASYNPDCSRSQDEDDDKISDGLNDITLKTHWLQNHLRAVKNIQH